MDEQPITNGSEGTDDPNLDEETASDREQEETIPAEPEDRPDPESADVDPAEIEAETPAGANPEQPVAAQEEPLSMHSTRVMISSKSNGLARVGTPVRARNSWIRSDEARTSSRT